MQPGENAAQGLSPDGTLGDGHVEEQENDVFPCLSMLTALQVLHGDPIPPRTVSISDGKFPEKSIFIDRNAGGEDKGASVPAGIPLHAQLDSACVAPLYCGFQRGRL